MGIILYSTLKTIGEDTNVVIKGIPNFEVVTGTPKELMELVGDDFGHYQVASMTADKLSNIQIDVAA